MKPEMTVLANTSSSLTNRPKKQIPSQSVQNPSVNISSLNDMFKSVVTVFQQIATELFWTEPEGDTIMEITKIILKPMKQNGCIQMACTADYNHDK
jgi:hypothetical protein